MALDDLHEPTFPSTTWRWKTVRIARAPQARDSSRRKALRWFGRPPRNPREPLTIKVKYRGGSECWYEIHARGSVGRWPGHVALHDVMREINCA